ncbi:MAG: SGNH hydrolase domain-containing protein, partial [Micropepsaceae bacterium]
IGLLFAIAAVATVVVKLLHGLPERLPTQALQAIENLEVAQEIRPFCVPLSKSKGAPCQFGLMGHSDFVIVGDSHAAALAPELADELLKRAGVEGITSLSSNGCAFLHNAIVEGYQAAQCQRKNEEVLAQVKKWHPRALILIARWANLDSDVRAPGDGETSKRLYSTINAKRQITLADALIQTIEQMKQAGIKVIIVGPVPEIDFDVPQALVRMRWYGVPVPVTELNGFMRRQRRVLASLAWTHRITGVPVVYPHLILCSKQACTTTIKNTPLYFDDDHLSAIGSKLVAPAIAKAADAILNRSRQH